MEIRTIGIFGCGVREVLSGDAGLEYGSSFDCEMAIFRASPDCSLIRLRVRLEASI